MRRFFVLLSAFLASVAPATAAPQTDVPPMVQEQRRALEARLDRLGDALRDKTPDAEKPRRRAQWYNWGNWSNGFSNWRNW